MRSPDAVVSAAEAAIAKGSQSFAAAARLFDREMREGVLLLYAWCRHCDDIVDGQVLGHGGTTVADAERRLAMLRADTEAALAGSEPHDPVFAGLFRVVHRHAIPHALPLAHLDGFAMDVANRRYRTIGDTLQYCYHVAGVVGLMMAHIMGVRDPVTLDRAADLGLAFQLTNIARDIVPDALVDRVYVPEDWLMEAGIPVGSVADLCHRRALSGVAARLVDAAEPYYRSARIGVADLPWRAAWAIATAHDVYRAIGHAVKDRGEAAWDARVSTPRRRKIAAVAAGAIVASLPRRQAAPRSPALWTRPA